MRHLTLSELEKRGKASPKRRLNLTGQRFGKLTAIVAVGQDLNWNMVWLCQCDCGQRTRALTVNLRSGTSKSCGCSRFKRGERG